MTHMNLTSLMEKLRGGITNDEATLLQHLASNVSDGCIVEPKLSDFTFEQRYWAKNPGVKASGA